MDFDIGNLLYVIITIVAIAIGLLGRKKKPAGQPFGEGGSADRPGFLENLERILNQEQDSMNEVQIRGDGPGFTEGEEEGPFPEEEGAVPVFEDEIERSVYRDEPAGRGMLEEYEKIMQRQQALMDSGISPAGTGPDSKPLEVIDLDEVDGTDYFEVVSEFNAATAIVYSAIINRIDY